MIKKNLRGLLISSAVILLPMVLGLIFWNRLPVEMPTHWGLSGQTDGWGSKAMVVFLVPGILLAVQWLCIFISAKDPKNAEQNDKMFRLVLWIIPAISVFINGIIYTLSAGHEMKVGVIFLLIGLMLVFIGNYMPKCRQNFTVGLKIKWTLENEENWNATHRFAGKISFVGGLVIAACVFLPEKIGFWIAFAALIVTLAMPVFYSWRMAVRQRKEGAVFESILKDPAYKKYTAIAVAASVAVLIFAAVLMLVGDINVVFGETSFTVEADFMQDITVDYSAVDAIEFREQNKAGSRTFGFGSARLLMGSFRNDEFGSYTRYTYTGGGACVVLTVDGKTLVLGGETDEATRTIYDELSSRLETAK